MIMYIRFMKHLYSLPYDAARDAFDADGTTPLMYCLDLPDGGLDKLFVACCLTAWQV